MSEEIEMPAGWQNQADWQDEPEAVHFSDFRASRRNFISSALLAIGVTGVALSDSTLALAAKARKAGKAAKSGFFDPARFAVLDAVTETIVPRTDTPGARDALVAKRLDALMKGWASVKTQTDFTRVLDEIEASARSRDPRGIASLPAAQQLDVVAAFDKAKMADKGYARFKNLVFALYYLSEPGATQELRYEHVPGAWEPSIAVTSDTRGYAVDVSFGGN